MKKIIIVCIAIASIAVAGCKKGDISGDKNALTEAAYLTLQSTISSTINYDDRATAEVGIKVGSVGVPVDKVNVYVVKGADLNKSNWKMVKSFPFSDGVTLNVKATEIATALGVSVDELEPGSSYTFYNEAVTKDGRNFSLDNVTTDFESQAPYNMALRWSIAIVCPFDPAPFNGNFVVDVDGWNDFAPGSIIAVKPGPGDNQISITAYPNPDFGINRKDIIVDVVPATGVASVAPQVYGDYPGFDTNLSVQTVGNANFVFACTGVIKLTLDHSSSAGDYGNYQLTLHKQ
ncbi:MAG: hypothetical protein ACM3H8_01620 [Sphingobacteriales bacterium]